ncbi:hypothetical protein [Streptomyces sp. NPDC059378]|uniref:hypothetical protein n=1 Tax=Streptomyces sp. NPDC059378 TaxID=3346815 RepID=UPI00368C722C
MTSVTGGFPQAAPPGRRHAAYDDVRVLAYQMMDAAAVQRGRLIGLDLRWYALGASRKASTAQQTEEYQKTGQRWWSPAVTVQAADTGHAWE